MTGEPQRRIFDDFAGHLFRRAQQRHAALWSRIVSDQVTGPQWATLAVIAERPGASQREVSAALDLDSSTIAALVARLEERDLLIREIDQDDLRSDDLPAPEIIPCADQHRGSTPRTNHARPRRQSARHWLPRRCRRRAR